MSEQPFKTIAVYCGSNRGNQEIYADQAAKLGDYLAKQGIELIYGGARVGLMGTLAEHVLSHQGKVTGVITPELNQKIGHPKLTRIIITPSMAERKIRMINMSDGMIALPGGIGTYEEIIEAVTLQQLKYHRKPCGILNVNNFFDGLELLMSRARQDGFMRQEHIDALIIDNNIERLFERMKNYQVAEVDKWTDRDFVTAQP